MSENATNKHKNSFKEIDMPKFTIITINYNNCAGLEKTIQSVVNQTYQDFEYIVIDGGSTDGSVDVIKKYADRIDYWVSEPDNGVYNAMNKGIAQSHGEYLNFMNSGDSFHSRDVLQRIYEQKIDTDFISGKTLLVGDKHSVKDSNNTENISLYFLHDTLCHQSVFTKKNVFDDNLYREDLKIVSDWLFFIKEIALKGRTHAFTDVIVADYDTTGISSTNISLFGQERQRCISELMTTSSTFRVLVEYDKVKNYLSSEMFKYSHRLYKHGGMLCRLSEINMRLLLRIGTIFNRIKHFLR